MNGEDVYLMEEDIPTTREDERVDAKVVGTFSGAEQGGIGVEDATVFFDFRNESAFDGLVCQMLGHEGEALFGNAEFLASFVHSSHVT